MIPSLARGRLQAMSFLPRFPRRSGRAQVILVDTHVVWLAFDQDQILRKAGTTIDDARRNAEGLAISDITLELVR